MNKLLECVSVLVSNLPATCRLAKFDRVPFTDVRVRSPEMKRNAELTDGRYKHQSYFWRLSTKVHVVSIAVIRLFISCSFPKTFAIKVAAEMRNRQKVEKKWFWSPSFYEEEGMIPQILNTHFEIALTCEHVAGFV